MITGNLLHEQHILKGLFVLSPQTNPYYVKPRVTDHQFGIKHYAGEVISTDAHENVDAGGGGGDPGYLPQVCRGKRFDGQQRILSQKQLFPESGETAALSSSPSFA